MAIDYVPDVTPYHVSGSFLIRKDFSFFFADTVSVHTYPVNPPGVRIRNFLNPLSRVEIFEYALNPEICGR